MPNKKILISSPELSYTGPVYAFVTYNRNIIIRPSVFVSVGLGLNAPDVGDAVVGWHFNPYLQIGEEWGAKFLVGIKLQSAGNDNKSVSWAIPIALSVGF